VDDARAGQVLRALRRRRGWRQRDLARAAGVSQATVSRLERGHVDTLSLEVVRAVFGALDARTELQVRWRGGQVDRLVDERHARLGATVTSILVTHGWQVTPEVTFQRYGERGSIDLLGAREEAQAVLMVELKSAVHSYEETQRRLDVKSRLAATIAEERLGWRPAAIGVVLVVEETTANRTRLQAIDPLVRAGLPADGRTVRRWVREPSGPLRGLWFLRPTHGQTLARERGGPTRVRCTSVRGRASRTSVA
jgi:transcriptional regulator with XRE-family HTH domain